jgi:hypothetical protein
MSWNKYQENILKKWSSMSKTYSTMHSIAAQYYSTWDKRLGIPVILLGAAAASSIFTSTNTKTDTNNIWAYINGGMVLLMTGISGISKFLGTHEKQAKHTSASFKYTHISMNIDALLSFPRTDREEQPRQFINNIKIAILEVREHSPDLPTGLVSDYIKKLDKSLTNTQTKVNRHVIAHAKVLSPDPYANLRKLNEWNSTPYKRDSVSPHDSKSETEPELTVTSSGVPVESIVPYSESDPRLHPLVPEKKEFIEQPNQLGDVMLRIYNGPTGHNCSQQRETETSHNPEYDLYPDLSEKSPDLHKSIQHITQQLQCVSDTESEDG